MVSPTHKRIAKNTLLLYLRTAIGLIVSLYTSRVILRVLGAEDYGIYSVVGGIVMLFTFLNVGMWEAIIRYFSYELGRENRAQLTTTFSTAVNIFIVLWSIVFLLAETVGLWFLNYKMNIPADRMYAANWVYQCSIVTFLVNLLSIPYNASIITHEQMKAFAYISTLEVLLKLLIVFMLVWLGGDKLILYALLMLGVTCSIFLLYRTYCKRHFSECRYQSGINRALFREMFGFVGWNFIGNMGNSIRFYGTNILLNLFFVIVCQLNVVGVALASAISQCVSATLVLLCLVKSDTVYRVELKKLTIYKDKLLQMVKIGVPAGIQSATFSISNVLIQSSVNSFGSIAMAGSTAGGNIEGFVWTAMDAFTQSTLSFTGQNYGAKKFHRITKVVWYNLLLVTGVGLVLGVGAYLLGTPLLSIYSTDPEVIQYGLERMLMVCVPYFTCGIMNVLVGAMRGLGSSLTPMVVSIFGVCVLRVVWIYTVFPLDRTFLMLFLSYPVTWVITALIEAVCLFFIRKRAIAQAGGMAADQD